MLVFVGIRLGLDEVNPVYYDIIKVRLPYLGGVFPSIYTYPNTQTLYSGYSRRQTFIIILLRRFTG